MFHDKFLEDSSYMGFYKNIWIVFPLVVLTVFCLPVKVKAEEPAEAAEVVPTKMSGEISGEKSKRVWTLLFSQGYPF